MVLRQRKNRFLEIRKPVGRRQRLISAIGIWTLFFGLWIVASSAGWVNELLVPAPHKVFATVYELFVEREFAGDVLISISRVSLPMMEGPSSAGCWEGSAGASPKAG